MTDTMRRLQELLGEVSAATLELLHRIAQQDVAGARWNAQLGPFLARGDVARLLARGSRPLTRQAVAQRRDLVAIDTARGVVYPVFQFDGRRPLAGLRGVLDALRDEADPLTIASWLTSPHPGLDGETPAEALRAGREAAAVREALSLADGLAS